MKFIIISDDLSGAAGMASMLGINIPVVPFHKIEVIHGFTNRILSVDLETRNSQDPMNRLVFMNKNFPEYRILTRIDTMLRGSTSQFIQFMSHYSNLAITDTIPEYGRYTLTGFTCYRCERKDINQAIPELAKNKVAILDSATYDDLNRISRKCIYENMTPVDPGPLISIYLRMIS
ncbi:MAG: hypothetical protein RE471_07095 [Ferroplasma sp.]|uniref:hypothetical protein n=1 Tax=Ferroplasma sp. TaxID=2591003 RepID=UPI002815D66D|nr:hypothetical protein [Ferroplasma sp.]WMT50740.1 MAG: hypothetical protein RE471_07095 [Ferroplasma sp.]